MQQHIEQGVNTSDDGETGLAQFFDEAGNIARIGNKYIVCAPFHEGEQVGGEREDMVERQRRDDYFFALLERAANPG